MSKERELLIAAVEWMHELKYVWADARNSGDRVLLELIADINKIEVVLAQPEQRLTPLTSKLISLGNNCHESFIKGVRFAEKMHGIGGGE